jgi:3-dehydroquinate synthase
MASSTTVTVPQAAERYPILIAAGLLAELPLRLQEWIPSASRVLVVTDTHVAEHYATMVTRLFQETPYSFSIKVLPIGESHKTLASLEMLYNKAIETGLKRNDAIVAIGGGVVGDITGFFASTYLRGVSWIQVPTTLLAQVDSSVGGKVAVNHGNLKNIIGAFYHPKGVLIDTDTLKTISARDFACGMAEVVKYSLIEKSIHVNVGSLREPLPLETMILRCCQLKAAVVEADAEERQGIREILNLGHTFAHAYEALSKGEIPHGEAVSIGLVKAFQLAINLAQISGDSVNEVIAMLESHHLPTGSPIAFSADHMLEAMRHDKKIVDADTFRLVLPFHCLGKVRVQTNISAEQIRSVL